MNEKLGRLEQEFAADVVFFYGEIHFRNNPAFP